jgi:uncharacterized small protein (DUF1192 family)
MEVEMDGWVIGYLTLLWLFAVGSLSGSMGRLSQSINRLQETSDRILEELKKIQSNTHEAAEILFGESKAYQEHIKDIENL